MYIIYGFLLGTFGLAWWHHFIHKYNFYHMSIIWDYHREHHKKKDPEQPLRQKYTMPVYALISMVKYLNPIKWRLFDWLLFLICLHFPYFTLVLLVMGYISESIGFVEHTYEGYPVDFTDGFINKVGFNCGKHTHHHNKNRVKYEKHGSVLVGLITVQIWITVCLTLYPLLLLSRRPVNTKGAYLFGLMQNLANYKAQEGISLTPLFRRCPSIFDKPYILVEYLSIIFTKKVSNYKVNNYTGDISKLKCKHDTSNIRNVYMQGVKPKDGIVIIYDNTVIEGHHRHLSGMSDLEYFEIEGINNV